MKKEPKIPDDTKEHEREAPLNESEDRAPSRRNILLGSSALVATATPTSGALAQAQKAAPAPGSAPASSSGRKPNILMIIADDIGWFNVSAYNLGVMGYRTPNIDRIAREGALFTDWYGEQSCTAGRTAFITGQSPIRTGLTKVGLPGSDIGLHAEDMSVAEALKPLGYATGQFGKNHLGDRNEYLPTVRGFDEFFGNLYHLNAEEEPQNPDYPRDPRFRAKFGPRGVLKCKASDTDDATVAPAYGRVGKQVIENTGPLDTKRMQTVAGELQPRRGDGETGKGRIERGLTVAMLVVVSRMSGPITGMPAHDDPPVEPIVARPSMAGPPWQDWPRQPDSIK